MKNKQTKKKAYPMDCGWSINLGIWNIAHVIEKYVHLRAACRDDGFHLCFTTLWKRICTIFLKTRECPCTYVSCFTQSNIFEQIYFKLKWPLKHRSIFLKGTIQTIFKPYHLCIRSWDRLLTACDRARPYQVGSCLCFVWAPLESPHLMLEK